MIIFGTRGVTYSANKGDFFCPSCRGKRAYSQKRVRQFFTLYFIPLIPMSLLGEYVECQACRGKYDLKILDYNPQAEVEKSQADFHEVLKRVMVEMMVADGKTEDAEVRTICRVYREMTGLEIIESQVKVAVDQVRTSGGNLRDGLSNLAGNLSDKGREMIVRSAVLVANSDGTFDDKEKALLTIIGESLGMTAAHLKGVLAEAQPGE